jgi:methionyl-tRNA formyltransferase
MSERKTAVVFGYGDMGVRGLKVLLDAGIDVKLVVTHKDSPTETIWFDSLEKTAGDYLIPSITPEEPQSEELLAAVKKAQPDFIFSFYYRFLLPSAVLDEARQASFNMHGSLLPKYRGRAPTNWAIVHGETETGATLHLMTKRADAGKIVDQMALPILGDDTAKDIFTKTLVTAELILHRSLPGIIANKMDLKDNPIDQGSYFGRRGAADGELLAKMTTQQLHNLVRAVAPPFPGAFVRLQDQPELYIYRTLVEKGPSEVKSGIYEDQGFYYLQNEPHQRLRLLQCGFAGEKPMNADDFFKKQKAKLPWRWI